MSDYWRSVLEACGGPEGLTRAGHPSGTADAGAGLGRRELIQLLGASVALAGLAGCNQRPREQIVPYVTSPRELTPGLPLQFATSMELDGFAVGLLVESHEGRPTKIEGNPLHPASLGASGVLEQASVLSLYDPSRLRGPRLRGTPVTWEEAFAALRGPPDWRPWFVLPPQSSPVTLDWLDRLRERYPGARFCFSSSVPRQAVYQATEAVFGEALETSWDFSRARVVLSLEADFLSQGPMSLRWARDYSSQRAPRTPRAEMSRSYVLESTLSSTGSVADHRLALRSRDIPRFAALLLGELGAQAASARLPGIDALGAPPALEASEHALWIRALARDLLRQRGSCLVVAGAQQGFETQVLTLALNAALGNLGTTLRLTAPVLRDPTGTESLRTLVAAADRGEVDALLVLDADPLYWASPEIGLERAFARVPLRVQLTQHLNATTRVCDWVLPLSHYLESWGDSRAQDGTLSYVQPLIEPLGATRSVLELLAACAGEPRRHGQALLQSYWRMRLGSAFAAEWPARLQSGVAAGSAFPLVQREPDWRRALTLARTALTPAPADGYELSFPLSASVYDGRFANNAWLLELSDPITKQSWGNALRMSPEDALSLGVSTGSVVEVARDDQSVRAPVFLVPGQARGTLALSLGWGHASNATLSDGVGVDAQRLRGAEEPTVRVRLSATADREDLAITQLFREQEGRDLALAIGLDAYRKNPSFLSEQRHEQPSLLRMLQPAHTGPLAALQWAMTIDTSLCSGCNACVIACQAENNVPVVGKREVQRGRDMHWLRIDSYAAEGAPGMVHQPMLCQHCETAPCEYVCPVNATVHSPDGLNEMVYNRCIGTRFCSNNCPYKVRRFNWFDYGEETGALASLQKNPEVTVRERGVMEKCTYCVQRIRGAERQARIEQREVGAGEVVTACQQACPSQAIQFGALSHAGTPMVEWRREPRRYAVLHELGTRPRTQYLARVSNENPELG